MPKVRPVRDVAPSAPDRAANILALQTRARISPGAARRYWYGTKDGKEGGQPLSQVDLTMLSRIAAALGVDWRDLLDDARTLQTATA